MAGSSVRINDHSMEVLREMAKAQSSSMQAILDKAIEAFRRQKFLESVNAGYAALRSDPTAWDDELRERSDWDQTLLDGLGPE